MYNLLHTGLSEGTAALVDWPAGMEDRYVPSNTSTISSAWVYYGVRYLGYDQMGLSKDSLLSHAYVLGLKPIFV